MAQITNIITIHEYNKMTAEQKATLSGDNLLAVVQQDWEEARIQAAIAAMQGMIANPQTFEQLVHDKGYQEVCGGDKSQIIAIASVMYADALVAELKKGSKNNEN